MLNKLFKGELVENRIVIWDIEQSKKIFGDGYYGKPLGVPKPKGTDFDAPLILDLIEGYHLVSEKRLTIRDSNSGKVVSKRKLVEKCESEYVLFKEKFLVYKELRSRGYIVTPGIKFGSDFAVYEHGPGIDHAPYLIEVKKAEEIEYNRLKADPRHKKKTHEWLTKTSKENVFKRNNRSC